MMKESIFFKSNILTRAGCELRIPLLDDSMYYLFTSCQIFSHNPEFTVF